MVYVLPTYHPRNDVPLYTTTIHSRIQLSDKKKFISQTKIYVYTNVTYMAFVIETVKSRSGLMDAAKICRGGVRTSRLTVLFSTLFLLLISFHSIIFDRDKHLNITVFTVAISSYHHSQLTNQLDQPPDKV